MMFRTLLLLTSFCLFGSISAQVVSIRGKAIDYAGKILSFYAYPEPVAHLRKKLAETTVAADGNFLVTFHTDATIEIYADLEKLRGTLVTEPGEQYQIELPPYAPRTKQEAASAYFEPDLFWLGIKNAKASDLNFLVRAFVTDYNHELDKHALDIYQKRSLDTLNAIVSRLEKKYPTGKFSYLNTLKIYSYGELEYAIQQPNRVPIINKYFKSKEVYLAHPAYQHLFNALYTDYLSNKIQDIHQNESLTKAFQGNFVGWTDQLTSQGYNLETAELLAVKGFFDGYYSGRFDKPTMLKGLIEASTKTTFKPLRAYLPEIIGKITAIQEGSAMPLLLLKKLKPGNPSQKTKGKYTYLAFFRSDSKVCKAELDSLVKMEKKLNSILTILPVSMDQNPENAISLWNDSKYPWELMQATEPEKARNDFEIKSLPLFYLISPDQKLVLAPALAPSHNFEALFLKIYRESRFRQQK